jgi:TonB family protein
VVIRKDGSVEASEIVQRSGSAAFDRSVTAVLNRVTTVGRPFPAGATDERRTYVIKFDLRAKRATG